MEVSKGRELAALPKCTSKMGLCLSYMPSQTGSPPNADTTSPGIMFLVYPLPVSPPTTTGARLCTGSAHYRSLWTMPKNAHHEDWFWEKNRDRASPPPMKNRDISLIVTFLQRFYFQSPLLYFWIPIITLWGSSTDGKTEAQRGQVTQPESYQAWVSRQLEA